MRFGPCNSTSRRCCPLSAISCCSLPCCRARIAPITSRDASGAINAAAFSFFNVFPNDLAVVAVGIGSKVPREPKDTRANIRETEQFVVNLVRFSMASEIRVTSIAFPKGID